MDNFKHSFETCSSMHSPPSAENGSRIFCGTYTGHLMGLVGMEDSNVRFLIISLIKSSHNSYRSLKETILL